MGARESRRASAGPGREEAPRRGRALTPNHVRRPAGGDRAPAGPQSCGLEGGCKASP